jgi:hypothetical protein
VIVDRWKRYGKDRLYVTLPSPDGGEGIKVGWWDLVADEAHPEAPEHAALLVEAVARWRSGDLAEAMPEIREVPAAEPVPPIAVSAPWHDLALNRPGEAARAEALAKRAEAPVKSLLARALGVHTDERAWRIGADGEELVAAQLAKAAKKDPRWRLLHSIPVGKRGSDIDHLIIGPGGVFTANAKHHPKAKIWVGGNTLLVDGHKTTHIRNARYEAERASRLLADQCGFPIRVHGLIVTVNASDITIKSQPEGVDVTWRNNLVKWLLSHGEILTAEVVDAIYEVARRSTTWTV